MAVYIILLLCAYISSRFSDKNLIHLVMFLFVFLLLACRDITVGSDTISYLDMIYGWNYDINFSMDSTAREMESLWFFLVNYVISSNLSSRWIIIIPAFFNILFVYLACKYYKVGIGMAIFFYILTTFYFLSFNIVRQCLAMSIVLFGSFFLSVKWKWIFFIFVALASLVHFSAIITILFYLIYRIEVSPKVMCMGMIASLLVGFVGFSIDFLEIGIYESYAENLEVVEESSFTRIVLKVLMTCFAVYFLYSVEIKNSFLVKMFFVSICLSNLFLNAHPFVARIMLYFTIFQPIYYSALMLINTKSPTVNRSIVLMLFVLVLFIYWIHYL